MGELGCRTARKSAYGVNWCVFEQTTLTFPDLLRAFGEAVRRQGWPRSVPARPSATRGVAVNSLWERAKSGLPSARRERP